MSNSRNTNKLPDKNRLETPNADKNDDLGLNCKPTESFTYGVTVSKKPSPASCEETTLYAGQKSFISIHSTDQPCQLPDLDNSSNLDECNVEVLSLNEVFPSTSEGSLSNEDESPVQRRKKDSKNKAKRDSMKSTYAPTNSKSSTSSRQREPMDGKSAVYSNIDIPKNTLYVIGSNPGEPKISYTDPPKKISKTVQEKVLDRHVRQKYAHACVREEILCRDLKPYFGLRMKKFLRNIDKHKNVQSKAERAISKLTTQRGILKDGRCGPECTGDNAQGEELTAEDLTLPFPMDLGAQATYNYSKQNPDKNVTFNTQVVIIHFTGDLCVGQSVEALSKEKDQQARNSELRKTFLTKYNEFWPTQK